MKKLSETLKEMGVAFSFPIKIEDASGNSTYFENSNGFWSMGEYDNKGNATYIKNSSGFWTRSEYDTHGKRTYFENSDGYQEGTPRAAMKEEA